MNLLVIFLNQGMDIFEFLMQNCQFSVRIVMNRNEIQINEMTLPLIMFIQNTAM